MLKMGFETLVEAGYAPEMAYFERVNELKFIIGLIYQDGLKHMRHYVSDTAKWDDITCSPKVIDEHVRTNMKKLLDDIQTGVFAREWVLENPGQPPGVPRPAQARGRAPRRGGRRPPALHDEVAGLVGMGPGVPIAPGPVFV